MARTAHDDRSSNRQRRARLIWRSENPRFFSTGADIGDLAQLTEDVAERARFRSEMREALNALALAENMTCPQLAPSV